MNEEKIVTLDDFNKQIVRPSVLSGIKSGQFDVVLNNFEERTKCICVYSGDIEILTAIIERVNILNKE